MKNIIKIRMKMAIKEAKKSLKFNDVPIGCVIFDENNKCIGKGFNSCIRKNDPSAHAEIMAIRNACKKKILWSSDYKGGLTRGRGCSNNRAPPKEFAYGYSVTRL